jgi:tetratricopeptide (TPR) repeat protein
MKIMTRTSFLAAVLVAVVLGEWCVLSTAAQSPPGGRVPPKHAASQQELNDYRAAAALRGGSAVEQAANAFANRYPASELRQLLFSRAMLQYQLENNTSGILSMGEQTLALSPDHPAALVLTATVLADSLSPDDLDRDRKIAEIKRNASRAIEVLQKQRITAGAGESNRESLQAMAYSALGLMRLKTGDYAEAEKNLKAALERATVRPDAYTWYHLALAQDHRKKYPSALNSVEQALQLASRDAELQKLAEVEHERLSHLLERSKIPVTPEQAVPDPRLQP